MPITVNEKSKVISAITQSVEGTANSGIGYHILTKDLTANIGVGDESTDEFDGIDTRDAPVSSGNLRNEFSFKFPVSFESDKGAANPRPPAWGNLLRMCGFDQTFSAANKSYTFTPSPLADMDLGTVRMRRPYNAVQDMEFAAYDARGILGIDLQAKQRPFFTVSNLSGTYIEPSIKSKATVNYNKQTVNLAGTLGKNNGANMTINGETVCVTQFTCDNLSGLTLNRDSDWCGSFSEAETTTPVGQVTMRSPDWGGEFNPFQMGRTDGEVKRYSFSIEIGKIALQRLVIECDEVQPVNPAEATVGSSTYGAQLGIRFLSPIRIVVK